MAKTYNGGSTILTQKRNDFERELKISAKRAKKRAERAQRDFDARRALEVNSKEVSMGELSRALRQKQKEEQRAIEEARCHTEKVRAKRPCEKFKGQ